METKSRTFNVKVKAASAQSDSQTGEVEMLVAVFDNVDSYGDTIVKGAFAESLEGWKARGDLIPFVWSHDWLDPFSVVGSVTKAAETDDGLLVTAEIDLVNPKAQQVYNLLKARRVTQASFAYDIIDAEWATVDGEEVLQLKKLDVLEVGPTLVGVNRDTQLLAVKSAKGSRLKTVDPERLVALRDALNSVLDDEPGKVSDTAGKGSASDTPDSQPNDDETASSSKESAQLDSSGSASDARDALDALNQLSEKELTS